ncbi:MAG: type II secretion system GspH family protein, partial [Puniceicoccales bacterium]|nr:type II secretion system GspH family protein [Puniceicoccales bacterium]
MKKRGFTLVELLVAIAVIGILMSMLISAVNKALDNARRIRGANYLRQIALAYNHYANGDVNGRNISSDMAATGILWAEVLAKGGYLNDPNMYCFTGDNGAASILKKTIVDTAGESTNAWGSPFPEGKDFSVWVINNIPIDAPSSTTPIAFTRGLQTDGTWSADGVYGTKGGYIAYLDSHVEWLGNLGGDDDGKLLTYGTSAPTNNIMAAIPSGATILSATG